MSEKPTSAQIKHIRITINRILREYAEALLLAILLAIFLRSFVVTAYKVPTSSMYPNLKVGDFIFAYKVPYGFRLPFSDRKWQMSSPKRGEVVVFQCPHNKNIHCVKRVVGLSGDRVELKDNQLLVNSQESQYKSLSDERLKDLPSHEVYNLMEEKSLGDQRPILVSDEESSAKNFGPMVVPPDHFFVLGDNRDSSDDSRFWGPLPLESLEGRASFVWMSIDWKNPWAGGKLPAIRWNRVFKLIE